MSHESKDAPCVICGDEGRSNTGRPALCADCYGCTGKISITPEGIEKLVERIKYLEKAVRELDERADDTRRILDDMRD